MQTHYPVPTGSPIVLLPDVERLLGRKQASLREDVERGLLPRPRGLGKTIFWLSGELLPALEALPHADKWPGPGATAPEVLPAPSLSSEVEAT